jgi:hypothetical protein
MKLFNIKNILSAAALAVVSLSFTACVNDLNVDNINPQQVQTPDMDAIFSKIYANMVLTG